MNTVRNILLLQMLWGLRPATMSVTPSPMTPLKGSWPPCHRRPPGLVMSAPLLNIQNSSDWDWTCTQQIFLRLFSIFPQRNPLMTNSFPNKMNQSTLNQCTWRPKPKSRCGKEIGILKQFVYGTLYNGWNDKIQANLLLLLLLLQPLITQLWT